MNRSKSSGNQGLNEEIDKIWKQVIRVLIYLRDGENDVLIDLNREQSGQKD